MKSVVTPFNTQFDFDEVSLLFCFYIYHTDGVCVCVYIYI